VSDRIVIENLSFDGRHGCLPFERETGVRFQVDVELEADLSQSAESDDLAHTVDYRNVAELVIEIGTERSFQLVERLADQIAREVLARFDRVQGLTVTIRKLVPVLAGRPEAVGVCIHRSR